MKLQILIPQYNETDDIIRPLLNSIENQQHVDLKNEVGVIIVNDGSGIHISNEMLSYYTYDIQYYIHDHAGVSATRNACMDYATADYVMFCDADDMFYSVCGLYTIFNEINNGGFDVLTSVFVEELRDTNNKPIYQNSGIDWTFIHGKVYRRQYLIDNDIRWNTKLTIHEDSYFNCLCQCFAIDIKHIENPFYLWRWREDSISRNDPKYMFKSYGNLLDSNDALIERVLKNGRIYEAQTYVMLMVLNTYFTLNQPDWLSSENYQYLKNTKRRFSAYWDKYKTLYKATPKESRMQIISGMQNKSTTFDEWIKEIELIKE